jgi:heme exporter protein A
MSMIKVKNLVKMFGLKTILKGMNFDVEPGEFVAFLGPNGAGKTTFLRILSSLSMPSFGDVKVAGYQLPQHAAAVRSKLGVLSHQPLLYGDLTAEENLEFFGRMYNVNDLGKRIDEMLEVVGLSKRRGDLVRTFSRGMQQRLAIGRAVVHNPEILLLDEPYTGLDQDASGILDDVLRTIASEGRTVIMTSHDLVRTEDMASRFDVLSKGKVIASTNKKNISKNGLLAFYRDAIERSKIEEEEKKRDRKNKK